MTDTVASPVPAGPAGASAPPTDARAGSTPPGVPPHGTAPQGPASQGPAPQGPAPHAAGGHGPRSGFLGMAVGSIGVVYGDIGTSPLYALKESLHHTATDGVATRVEVIGVVSLLIWALIVVVTLKYIIFILQADNKGEGGTLSLMALVQSKVGRRRGIVFALGVMGAALFYGDSIITPAISVLSAVEGLRQIDALKGTPIVSGYSITILALVVLVALFAVQSRGTGRVAAFFGPIMLVWFATLGGFGLLHISDDLQILNAFNPYYAAYFLANHGLVGLIVLGSVFLAVTGAEALYADMGHFGRAPIRAAWLAIVFPCLVLNYLGQGALILKDPTAMADRNFSPFYALAPEPLLLPFILLALIATVIASQAVITGAFSLTQQAVQLGLLPRLEIRHTSETTQGQIYLPRINRLLMVGVMLLVLLFRDSSSLANAYGIAVTGAMLADAGLFYFVTRDVWKWRPWLSIAVVAPFFLVDLIFFGANLLKLLDGAWMPLVFGLGVALIMVTWVRGSHIVSQKAKRESLPLVDLMQLLKKSKPHRVPGTAVFMTAEPEMAPTALMHNLKHNRVLHTYNVFMTIRHGDAPRVPESRQLTVEDLGDGLKRIRVDLGYLDTPRVPHLLAMARRQGLEFDLLQTSFFLGRRVFKASPTSGMPLWQDRLFIGLTRSATNATDFFGIPAGRVVELGSQMTV